MSVLSRVEKTVKKPSDCVEVSSDDGRGGLYMVLSLIKDESWLISKSRSSIDVHVNRGPTFLFTVKPLRKRTPTPPPVLFGRGHHKIQNPSKCLMFQQ